MNNGTTNNMNAMPLDEKRVYVNDLRLAPSRRQQFLSLFILGIRQMLFSRFFWVLVIIGGLPVIISAFYFIGSFFHEARAADYAKLNTVYQIMFRTLYIHFIIFFVANIFGFSLLRKELDDRTLHYLFLQPVSKISIIISKYLAFLVLTWTYLSVTYIATYFLLQTPHGISSVITDLFEAGRAYSIIKCCGVMLVALSLYGAISMVMGSFFKSGTYAIIFLGWETALPYLPSTLKYFTISHYLQSITPERSAIPDKMYQLYGTMPTGLHCFMVLTFVLALFIGVTSIIIRFTECRYSDQ